MERQNKRPAAGVRIRLCGVQGCCPEVEFLEDGSMVVRDDGGGKVTLTPDQQTDLARVIATTQK